VSAIAGVWRFGGNPTVDADCAKMLTAQQIYGPHDGRQWSNGVQAMGRRLFRLLPEDVFDRQPLQSRDGRLTLVADARLDNREDLARVLGLTATDTKQLCDAALLLEAFTHWGEGALTRLVGDFALALWDSRDQRFLLARDFIGQKPLHYHRGRDFFAFASMPKGLHALAEIPYRPDEQLVAELLVLMPRQGPRSFFTDIARVEPGHVVTITHDGITSRKYWQPQRLNGSRLQRSDYVEGLRHHLDQATQSQLRGVNGAVAAQLSAGFDSGMVTATAARLLAPRGGKVIAFTAVPRADYGFKKTTKWLIDEEPLAAATAAMYPNIEHLRIRSAHRSPLDELDRAIYLCDRPIVNPCNEVWVSAIHQAAHARKLSVLLVGVMGNMTASYDGRELLHELLLAGRFVRFWQAARALLQKGNVRGRRGLLIDTLGPFMPARLWRWANRRLLGAFRGGISDYSAIRPDRLVELSLAALARARDLDFSYRPWTDGFAMRLWVMNRFDNGDLNKGALGGWGVDWRAPLADKRLVEFCLSIPTDEYLRDGVPRALAREALAGRLPHAVLSKRRSGYQAADWHEGLTAVRSEVAAELDRLAACAPAARALDIEKMKRLTENWPTGEWESNEIVCAYRLALLRGISAGHFLRRTSGAN
jgi:asparagine synthase (glutamine-hydrolysing)